MTKREGKIRLELLDSLRSTVYTAKELVAHLEKFNEIATVINSEKNKLAIIDDDRVNSLGKEFIALLYNIESLTQ